MKLSESSQNKTKKETLKTIILTEEITFVKSNMKLLLSKNYCNDSSKM